MLMNILKSGVFAGFIAGLITAILHLILAVPIIAKSELFEAGKIIFANGSEPYVKLSNIVPEMRSMGEMATTAITTIISAIGLGLILSAGMNLRNEIITPKQGAVWGIFGFIAFILAPSFGLPPELPGSGSDTIHGRQVWWLLTVLATIIGLWQLAFKYSIINIIAGIVLITLPHIIEAPQPVAYIGTVPPEMSAHFVSVSLTISMIMWILIGFFIPIFSKK